MDETEASPPLEKRPCPFCGHRRIEMLREARYDLVAHPEWETDPDAYAFYASCTACACQGPWRKSPTSALRAWNQRVSSEEPLFPPNRMGRPPKAASTT